MSVFAYEQMLAFNRRHPESRDVYKQMQQWHVKNKPDNGMFCPMEAVKGMSPHVEKALMLKQVTRQAVPSPMVTYFWSLGVYGTWRNTLGIYDIDSEIVSQLAKAPIPTETPTTIFSRLPEWCVYVSINSERVSFDEDNVRSCFMGFWAMIDEQFFAGKKHLVLSLISNMATKDSGDGMEHNAFKPLQLIIEDGLTIEDSIKKSYGDVWTDGLNVCAMSVEGSIDRAFVTHLLSMLLWLCAEEPDITNMAGEPVSGTALRKPKYTQNKKTGAFVPPNAPTIYHVGKRLGGEVREFNARSGHSDARTSSRKRPHIRRGHWHGVWRGTGQNKAFHVYWQPAVFVNAGY